MSNYRVLLNFDPERSVFVARAPELEHCSAEGATRAEAIGRIEEEIDAQVRNIREHGGRLPAAIDDEVAAFTGEITAKVSRTLHRDLVWQARTEGVELPQLLGEMLAVGLETRRQRGGRRPVVGAPAQAAPEARPAEQQPQGDEQPRANDRGGRPFRPSDRSQGGRYHAIMEDRATFLEYVRGLESGGGRGPGGGGGGRRRGRPGPGGGGEPGGGPGGQK